MRGQGIIQTTATAIITGKMIVTLATKIGENKTTGRIHTIKTMAVTVTVAKVEVADKNWFR